MQIFTAALFLKDPNWKQPTVHETVAGQTEHTYPQNRVLFRNKKATAAPYPTTWVKL